jgi:LPXTG-motif cell wall-anchored protein
MSPEDKRSAVAAGIILVGFTVAFFFLPRLVVALGETSPLLGFAAGALLIAAFFGVFWLRRRFKR